MLKKFLITEVPLYIVVSAVVLITGSIFLFGAHLRETSYESNIIVLEGATGIPYIFEFGSSPLLAQPDFFKRAKGTLVSNKLDFIEADLSAMRLRVYRGGDVVRDVEILAKGKPGSWWETPAGIYKIESKKKNHFSSFGRVYQPWSMAFQGNFFIHGWPYYEGGAPVASSYSGGCIRLSDEDAAAVYDLVHAGEPVLVFEKEFESDQVAFRRSSLELPAKSYLVADLSSNFVFLEKNSQKSFPIASIAKLMTALIATEYINLDRSITIAPEMVIPTSRPRLRAGQAFMAYDLLQPLLLESSNEAAEAFARTLGQKRFVELMNSKARSLGMNSAYFEDAAGSAAGNVASAEDLFGLAKYLYHNRSFILKFSSGKDVVSAYGEPYFKNLENFNVFGSDPGFVGGKVGKTEAAEETILSVFTKTIGGMKRPIVIIILGSEDNARDALRALQWVSENYQ